jgi:coenzyme F420-0:L-glutamate ligase / coenzyme F420-1:gamma-L-glutamate ligase
VTARVEIEPIGPIGEIREGDALGRLIADAAGGVDPGDLIVISQKVVSKSEGRIVDLASVEPGARAAELASALDKDPRVIELVLGESRRVVRAGHGVLIVETRHGFVCANAGIDASNVPGDDRVTLLPVDPDASARRIRAEIGDASGVAPGVIVADSFGRAWRMGQVDVAIGCAGVTAIDDWYGRADRGGRQASATAIAVADAMASAADLARDKASGDPVMRIRGLATFVTAEDGPGAAPLRRAAADDLFR